MQSHAPSESAADLRVWSGYTLLEVVGTLAILAILAAALVPAFIKHSNQTNLQREVRTLADLAAGLQRNILRSRTIPDATTLPQVLATEMSLPMNAVTSFWGNRRVFLVDPAFRVGSNATLLPFTQGPFGSQRPANPRLMLISSVAGPALPLVSGPTNTFDSIWNTMNGSVPVNWPAAWNGQGESLLIHRLDLRGLFNFHIFSNLDPDRQGFVAVDDSAPLRVPTNGLGLEGYYLLDTTFSFFDASNNLVTKEISGADASYVFEKATWHGYLLDGRERTMVEFKQTAEQFLATATNANPGAQFGARATNILDFFCMYGSFYAAWAAEGFQYTNSVSQQHMPYLQAVQDYQALLDKTSKDLINP